MSVVEHSASRERLHPSATSRREVFLGALLIVSAIALAYANSLRGPFVYDDKTSITYNESIRQLWPVSNLLHPPGNGATVSGRPVLNATFALNYAFGGLNPVGYHVTNILIHALAALTLFGLLRRTLRLPTIPTRLRDVAAPVATVISLLWALHPLHTEAVTYLAQRAESLMSLFYLLTLYCFVRGVEAAPDGRAVTGSSAASEDTFARTHAPQPRRVWLLLAWIACLLGMATKENMVSAPLIVFLYDRAFISGGVVMAWRRRRSFYVALLGTWIVLGALVASTGGDRGGSAGVDVGVSFLAYALTQFPALVRYGVLTVWPHPLVFDYGPFFIHHVGSVAWEAAIVLSVIAASLYAFVRAPKVGFLAALAFAVLAPTSLVPGTTQMIVEHRMYLPLAAVLCLAAPLAALSPRRLLAVVAVLVALGLGLVTAGRNRAYDSELRLWADTVAKRPDSAVAHSSYGAALKEAGHAPEAIAEQRAALKLDPNYAPALSNLGIALTESGQPTEAIPILVHALSVDPRNPQAHLNLGVTLDLLHRPDEALPHYEQAVQLNPLLPAAHNDYGDALCRAGKVDEGVAHLQTALAITPDYAEAYFNLAAALVRRGQMSEGQTTFATGANLRPTDGSAHLSWANFLLRQGHRAEALAEYQIALRLAPDSAEAHYSYATALAGGDRYDDAIREYQTALRLRPDYAEAHNNLGNALLAADRVAEAIPSYETALRLRPDDARTQNNLGLALARSGHLREAVEHFAAAVRLAPDFDNARQNLAHARAQLDATGGR
jgi:tetratricopeptide (TPR) repeat protein